MVMAGAEGHDGLLRVALTLDGQSAEVVMAARLVLPDPPLGGGLVVEVVEEDDDDDEVVVAALFLPGLKMANERPTTTAATMTKVMVRRSVFLRFSDFCSAANRAWRPAFWR